MTRGLQGNRLCCLHEASGLPLLNINMYLKNKMFCKRTDILNSNTHGFFPPTQSDNAPTKPKEPIHPITSSFPSNPMGAFYNPTGKPIPPMAILVLERTDKRQYDDLGEVVCDTEDVSHDSSSNTGTCKAYHFNGGCAGNLYFLSVAFLFLCFFNVFFIYGFVVNTAV